MDKLQEISIFVENMKIKKSLLGGYNREDVMVKMQELVGFFQEYVAEEQQNHEKIIADYEVRIQTSQMLVEELNKKVAELSGERQNMVHKDYCSTIFEQCTESLTMLSTELAQTMNNIAKLQQDLLEGNPQEATTVEYEEEI